MRRRFGATVASVVVGLVIVLVPAAGLAAEGEASASLEFGLSPKHLPARGRQVTRLRIGIEERGAMGISSGIASATVGIDKAIELDPVGLAACRHSGIQIDSAGADECGKAVVGHAEA